MNSIAIARKYFEVSNKSDFVEIWKLLSDTTTYSSQNTWLYLWVESILEMQQEFHDSYESLKWEIQDICEENPWIVRVEFDFIGIKQWEEITFSWIEYIIVVQDKIQHIEIRNK